MTEAGTIKVLSTLAAMGAINKLLPRLEQLIGAPIAADFAPTNALVDRIKAGEAADLAILTAASCDELHRRGVLGPRTDVAVSFVGIAVKAGAPKPDISSVEALKRTLLDARSIAYSKIGASGIFFAELIQRLGVAAEVNAKATVIPSGFTAERAASGACELAVQQISELMVVPGIDIVGPLPPGADSATIFSAAVLLGSPQQEAAARLAEALRSPEAAAMFKSMGLEPAG